MKAFQNAKIPINDIFWFAGFWQITIAKEIDIQILPYRVAGSPAFYRTITEAPNPNPAALRSIPPEGVEYNGTLYMTALNALLRPGILLNSSARTITADGRSEDFSKTITS